MKKKDELLATLTLHGYSELKPRGKVLVRNWLYGIWDLMCYEPNNFSKRFTAKYHRPVERKRK